MRVLAVTLALLLLLAGNAGAQGQLERAAEALELDPVYVHPDAERAIGEDEAERLRESISRSGAGPMYLAVLPAGAAREAGGDPGAAVREIALTLGEPGTYAAVIGDSFRAGSTELPEGRAGELAADAISAERGNGTAAVLEDFVARVADARDAATARDGGSDGGGAGFAIFLALLLVVAVGLFGWSRVKRRRSEQADLAEVKEVTREDLIALGDDIRALDLDVEMPGIDDETKQHYGLAVERYGQADEAWRRARRPSDMERVTSLLEEGRWAMTAAKAKLAGEPVPERRPPCFFDPRHGPSVGDVEWAPPDGQPRPVPVCAADLQRIRDGVEPYARHVQVNGESVPYWNAGPALTPWAGGFYGGGLLPGLFIGSMLGGGFGDIAAGEAIAADTGDFGGGGFGGGDFGGFGGGDFGGGG
ncbi:MAG: hypothetical protein ICV69_06215 [Thermoleophilaceae bacterium]|nr:hypothetical protein [Thermoleophilaceae bacterium]